MFRFASLRFVSILFQPPLSLFFQFGCLFFQLPHLQLHAIINIVGRQIAVYYELYILRGRERKQSNRITSKLNETLSAVFAHLLRFFFGSSNQKYILSSNFVMYYVCAYFIALFDSILCVPKGYTNYPSSIAKNLKLLYPARMINVASILSSDLLVRRLDTPCYDLFNAMISPQAIITDNLQTM